MQIVTLTLLSLIRQAVQKRFRADPPSYVFQQTLANLRPVSVQLIVTVFRLPVLWSPVHILLRLFPEFKELTAAHFFHHLLCPHFLLLNL